MSHPSWVRGLKLSWRHQPHRPYMSHPSWVRGLKLAMLVPYRYIAIVAPLVGAWIETIYGGYRSVPDVVAPLVGAWIETVAALKLAYPNPESHPSWVRGLKPLTLLLNIVIVSRTPRGCVD